MAVPVLIAAKDEEEYIERTLEALPRNSCEPIVLANGCTDRTPDIASRFDNVELIIREEPGKLPAIQDGLRRLGKRAAEPLIFLDADTQPLMPKNWVRAMLQGIEDPQRPAFIVGPVVFDYPDLLSRVTRSAAHYVNQWRSRNDPKSDAFSGRNTIVNLGSDALEEVLALPNIWPGEDTAIKDKVVEHGGIAAKSSNLGAAVLTDSERYPNVFERLRISRKQLYVQTTASYLAEAPPGSITYDEYRRQQAELQAVGPVPQLQRAA